MTTGAPEHRKRIAEDALDRGTLSGVRDAKKELHLNLERFREMLSLVFDHRHHLICIGMY